MKRDPEQQPKESSELRPVHLDERPPAGGSVPTAPLTEPVARPQADPHLEAIEETYEPAPDDFAFVHDEKAREAELAARREAEAKRRKNIREWILTFAVAILVGLFLRTFVIQRNLVRGPSMDPTFTEGDQLIVEMVTKHFREIPRGTVVTVDAINLPSYENYKEMFGERAPRLIKRVVGLPGERIQFQDGKVLINGEVLDEPYLSDEVVTSPSNPAYVDVTLADNEYFVLGDNRPHSKDSRSFGPVPKSEIIGEFWVRIYPWSKAGKVD